MTSRAGNERKFGSWEETVTGGRIYRRRITGRSRWSAVYCKEVDSQENAVRFWQEIFDEAGQLREIHEKFPVDRGQQQV